MSHYYKVIFIKPGSKIRQYHRTHRGTQQFSVDEAREIQGEYLAKGYCAWIESPMKKCKDLVEKQLKGWLGSQIFKQNFE